MTDVPVDVNAPSSRLQWQRLLLALHAVGGKVESINGRAIHELHDRTGVELGTSTAKVAEHKGYITRKLNGKRTLKIELTTAGLDHLTTTLIPRYKIVEPEPEPVVETPTPEPEPVVVAPVVEPEPVVVDKPPKQVTITLTGTPREMMSALRAIEKQTPDSRLDHVIASLHHLDQKVEALETGFDEMARMVDMVEALHAVWIGEPDDEARSNVAIPGPATNGTGNNGTRRRRTNSISKVTESNAALRKVTNKDWRDLYRAAAEQGCLLTPVSNGHIKITYPNGETRQLPGTPSEYRGLKNQRAEMRRQGIAV